MRCTIIPCFFIAQSSVRSLICMVCMLSSAYHRRMDALQRYLSYRQVSRALCERIQDHHDFVFAMQQGMDEREIVEQLPTHMRRELRYGRTLSLQYAIADQTNMQSIWNDQSPSYTKNQSMFLLEYQRYFQLFVFEDCSVSCHRTIHVLIV